MTHSPEPDIQGFDDKPGKKFNLPKSVIMSGVIVAVLVGIALVLPAFLDQDKYKGMIIQKVEESTGYNVTWAGDLGISILPVPHITIHKVSVTAGSQKIVTIKQVEVSVELVPLLQKKIEISSVKLIEPDINLLVDASGRQTWMTDRLTKEKDRSETSMQATQEKQSQEISFGSIEIENGHIVYKDSSKNSIQEISNLNTDLSAKSLSGPFDGKANLVYNGNEIALNGEAGKLEEGKPTAVDFDIQLPKLDVNGKYKGEITTGEDLSVKGDLKLTAKDLDKTLSALFKSDSELPEELNGALDLSTAVLYDGDNASLGDLVLSLGELSYKGAVKLAGLKTSPSPKLTVDLVSTSKNVQSNVALVKALSDLSVKGTGTYINNVVTIQQGIIGFEGQTVNFAGTYSAPVKAGTKSRVNATVNAGRIDIDDLNRQLNPVTESAAQKAVNEKTTANPSPQIKGVSLPFDGTVSGTIGSLSVGGKTYSNLAFNLTGNGNSLAINNLSLNTLADTTVAAKGTIADMNRLSGFDINANVKTGNVEGLAKAYDVPLKLEQTLGAAAINGNFKGSLENLSFNATVDALNFAVTGVGSVKAAMTNPIIETLNLRVKHPSLQAAIRNFSPGFEAPGSFNGPLDLSTTIALDQKKYNLTNIKGTIGSTSIAGNLNADMSAAEPAVNGSINFGSMTFDTPAPQAGTTPASGKPSSAPSTNSGETRWSREAIDTSWMNKFNADLSINATSITQGLWKLTNARLAFGLKDGYLTIKNMDADAFGGNIAINGNMKGGNAKSPLSMNWTAKATAIDARQMLSALQNKQSDTVSGKIKTFDVDVSTSGLSPAALVYALNGKGGATGSDLVIKGVDAAKLADAAKGSYKPLERAGSLFGSFKDGQTSFSTFDMAYTITNGVVNFTQMKFDGPQATLSSIGNVNLPRWTVDLKNTMTVKNSEIPAFDFTISGPLDNPLQAGGSVIEGFLRQKAQAKIEKLITNKLGDKLGLPAGILGGAAPAPAETTPVAGTDTASPDTAPAQKTKEQEKSEQIEQGVKAIQGLFGR